MDTNKFEIDPVLLAEFEAAKLFHGSHKAAEGNGCAMEWAAKLAKEPWSDHPQCVCPVIGAGYRRANDSMGGALRNELLKPIVPLALDTRSTREVELRRMYMAADWAVRCAAPMSLRARGRADLADQLEKLPQVVDRPTAGAARDAAHAAAYAATDAAYAATDAAYAASAAYAAYAASAYDAAYAAYAAYDAAAAYAAYDAAAAYTKRTVWASYCDLLTRMCAVTE